MARLRLGRSTALTTELLKMVVVVLVAETLRGVMGATTNCRAEIAPSDMDCSFAVVWITLALF